jgi:hypothetical protein
VYNGISSTSSRRTRNGAAATCDRTIEGCISGLMHFPQFLLGASNYCAQLLVAPTRSGVDEAYLAGHRHKKHPQLMQGQGQTPESLDSLDDQLGLVAFIVSRDRVITRIPTLTTTIVATHPCLQLRHSAHIMLVQLHQTPWMIRPIGLIRCPS